MKQTKLFLLFAMLTLAGIAQAANDKLVVQDVSMETGSSVTLDVVLENETTNLMGFQCDIVLPEGLTLKLKSNGKPAATLGSRFEDTGHSISSSVISSGAYRFIATSLDGEAIPETSGTLFTVTLQADASLASGTTLEGVVKNIEFNTQDNQKLVFDEATFSVSTLGEVEASEVTVISCTREYGEANPAFEFSVKGTDLVGTPEITCAATPGSPVGTYDIVISQGTVTNANVTFVNGTLTITKAPLTIKAGTYTKKQGEQTPEFILTFEGFKNNETNEVLSKQPTVYCEATEGSAPGEYPVTVSGAEAQNYEISYINGKLVVKEAENEIVLAFEVDGISYYVTKQTTEESLGEVQVTGGEIKEEIVIPETVTYDDVAYMVTSIGENAFSARRDVGNYTRKYVIPGTVRTIGSHAFYDNYYLEEVEFNEGLLTIDAGAFEYNFALKEIRIPSTVTAIAENVFHTNQQNLATIYCLAETPPAIQPSTFEGRKDATLVVPQGSLADYKSAGEWEFDFMFEEGEAFGREYMDEQGILYTLIKADDDSYYYSVTGHSDELNAEIMISADLGGHPVKTIGDHAFYDCTSLSSVTIPNSVTTIDDWAFAGCGALPSITIPNSVTSIGARVFQGCSNLATVRLGSQLSTIGDYAFHDCTSLSSINIPDNVTNLGQFAFLWCRSLTSVTIGSGVTSLKAGTFHGCSSLTTITIPDNVISIEDAVNEYYNGLGHGYRNGPYGVFTGCSSLTSVTIGNGVSYIGSRAFYDGVLTSITIPNSVTGFGAGAFRNNKSLTTLNLGDGITEIASDMFMNCELLSSVIIPNGVTTIESSAFLGCRALTSIKLPESLTSMGDDVFMYCPMKSIELPNSFTIIPENQFSYIDFQYIKLGNNVKSIGKNAFGSSEPVIEIATSTPPTISNEAFPNVEYLSDLNVIVPNAAAETAYRKAAVWQEMTFSNQNNVSEVTVETPGDLSFDLIMQCNMMPAKVVGLKVNGTINADDFTQMLVNMKSLLRLDLTDCDITEIPDDALKGKQQLRELALPTKLLTIGQGAFQDCTFLENLTLQAGLQTIGQSAFQNCTSLQVLTLQTGLQTIGQSAFQNCIGLTGELSLPSTVTTIGASAFVGTGCTSVKMPNALKAINDYAFYNVPISQRLVLPGRVQSVGVSAFEGTKINGLVIPDGVTSIGDRAFADTPIQGHVTIPDGVTYLGTEAFSNSQLSTVFLPNSIETISQGLFQGCPNLDLVYVPDNYSGVSGNAFDGCGSLQVLRLSANLASMGEYSFQNTPLEYLKVPSQVETLSKGTLKNCRSLESLTLPANMKTVETEALYGCTALRNLSVEAVTPPVIKDRNAIRGINTDKCLISIPTTAYRAYVLAEYWGQFVQMRNDIAVETVGNGEIAFESVEEEEDEEVSESRQIGGRHAAARAPRRAPQLASNDETMTYANNGSSVYVPQQGQVRFYIIPAAGEELLSATLDGEDIMPYIVDNVYTATADKKNAKLVVKFSGDQGTVATAGDVNGDGDVDIADAVQIVNHVVGKATPQFVAEAADVNSDGDVDIADAVRIVNLVVGKITSLSRLMNFFQLDPQ